MIGTVLIWIGGLCAAAIGAVVVKIAAQDVEAWTPHIVKLLVNQASRSLPEDHRERMVEEWLSHSDELPGVFAKVFHAMHLRFRVGRLRPGLANELQFDEVGEALFAMFTDVGAAIEIGRPLRIGGPRRPSIRIRLPRWLGSRGRRTLVHSFLRAGRLLPAGYVSLIGSASTSRIEALLNLSKKADDRWCGGAGGE